MVYRARNGFKTLIHVMWLMLERVENILTIQMKVVEQYFPVVLPGLYKIVEPFEHVSEL